MLDTIRNGSSSDLVKVAQYLTNYVTPKNANGKFSDGFFSFIQNWQLKNRLNADGVIGKDTWTKIAKQLPTCSTSKNKNSSYTCGLQLLLGGLVADGIYGTNTKKAVVAYQTANNLSADGICGPKTWNMLITGNTQSVPSSSSSNQKPIDYKQGDKRWGKIKYSTHTSAQTIANSGCGPTAMADIVATWWDKNITPKELCELSVENGYRTYNSGTAWGFFEFCAKKYGAAKFITTKSISTLKAALTEGAYAVVSFGPSKWTNGGHYCCIWNWDGKNFYINDPASSSSSRAKGTEKEVVAAAKQYFIFYKDIKTVEPTPEPTKKEETVITPAPQYNLDGKIIDISKWQGNIDFDALKPEVSLVIARASCGSDKDTKIDEYAKAMNERHIPFGVYCYSYAGTKEKAVDEAQKIVKYAEQYNPLFYVLDAEEAKLSKETIEAFVDELRKHTNKKIGCYIANHRYDAYKYSEIGGKFDFTWIPSYGKNDGTIAGSKKPAHFCDLWQYTSTAKISGILGNVDMNVITGDGITLKYLLGLEENNAVG